MFEIFINSKEKIYIFGMSLKCPICCNTCGHAFVDHNRLLRRRPIGCHTHRNASHTSCTEVDNKKKLLDPSLDCKVYTAFFRQNTLSYQLKINNSGQLILKSLALNWNNFEIFGSLIGMKILFFLSIKIQNITYM